MTTMSSYVGPRHPPPFAVSAPHMSNPSPGGNYQMRLGMMSGMPSSHMGQDGLPNQHVPNQMVSGQQGFMHGVSPNRLIHLFILRVEGPAVAVVTLMLQLLLLEQLWWRQLLLLQRPLLPQPLLT